VPPSQPQY